jgi:hypothetical protein
MITKSERGKVLSHWANERKNADSKGHSLVFPVISSTNLSWELLACIQFEEKKKLV